MTLSPPALRNGPCLHGSLLDTDLDHRRTSAPWVKAWATNAAFQCMCTQGMGQGLGKAWVWFDPKCQSAMWQDSAREQHQAAKACS